MPDAFLRKVLRDSTSRCRRRASTASAWCSCRSASTSGTNVSSSSRRSSARKARSSSAGAGCPSTRAKCGPLARESMPEIRRSSSPAAAHPRTTKRSSASSTSSASAWSGSCGSPGLRDSESFYVPSLSSNTINYKGLLLPYQIPQFYRT
jgi:glutamate synthase domain-containing protein 1